MEVCTKESESSWKLLKGKLKVNVLCKVKVDPSLLSLLKKSLKEKLKSFKKLYESL